MQPRHIILAIVLSVFWGLNFVVIAIGLTDFPPLLLATLRFALTALPVLFLPRPPISWGLLIAAGTAMFFAQFSLLFTSMDVGMPAGLASIALQVQAFITIAIAAAVLHEFPTPRQMTGAAVAFGGLALVAATVGADGVTLPGFILLMAAAVCWATGNILVRRAGPVDMLAMVSWMALVVTVPQALLSLIFEGPERIIEAFGNATWLTAGAVAYIAFVSTTFGYAFWGYLLKTYPAATAAPFSLLVPVSGTISAYLILGETFGPLRLGGMGLILVGLAILVIGHKRRAPPVPGAMPANPG